MTHAAALQRFRDQAAALVAAGKPYFEVRKELIRSAAHGSLHFLRRETWGSRTEWRDAARAKGRPRPVVLNLIECRHCRRADISGDPRGRYCSGKCRAASNRLKAAERARAAENANECRAGLLPPPDPDPADGPLLDAWGPAVRVEPEACGAMAGTPALISAPPGVYATVRLPDAAAALVERAGAGARLLVVISGVQVLDPPAAAPGEAA